MEPFYTLATFDHKLFFMGPAGDSEIFFTKEAIDAEKTYNQKEAIEMLNLVKRKTRHCFLDGSEKEIPLPALSVVKITPNFIIEEVITESLKDLCSYKENLLKELNQIEEKIKKLDIDYE